MKNILLFCILLIFFINNLHSQIGMYPQAVFLDTKNRSSNIKVLNSSKEPKEISISFKFGYSGYDSLGSNRMISGDSLPEAKFSAVPYVKVYPKKLILQPDEEQIIRFMLGNTSELSDGTYYCRIFLESKNPPGDLVTEVSEKIQSKIEIQFTLVAALILQKGKRDCSLNLSSSGVRTDSANVNILVNMEHTGNSPFLGTSEISVYDMDGKLISNKKEMTPVYFSAKKAFTFPKDKFLNGKYQVGIIMSNEHKDVPDDFKTPIKPVKSKFIIDLTDKL
jgi:hypothetical protein